jgi:hypothetical protein
MMELCQCENKYDIRTGVAICTVCNKSKIDVTKLPTVKQMQSHKDYLNSLKDTPTP